jgi:hypothetical protein
VFACVVSCAACEDSPVKPHPAVARAANADKRMITAVFFMVRPPQKVSFFIFASDTNPNFISIFQWDSYEDRISFLRADFSENKLQFIRKIYAARG